MTAPAVTDQHVDRGAAGKAGAAAAAAGTVEFGNQVLAVTHASVRLGHGPSARTLWSGVDFTQRAGEFAAVLGPNGVGKSTLIRAVLGTQPLASGRISVLGRPPGHADQVGYLPQRRSFDARTRIRALDVVRLGHDGNRPGVPLPFGRAARDRNAAVDQALAMVGAEHLAGRPIGELSGGEQQRVLIAQALVRRPRLLVLDEPLDSLDLPNQAAVSALLGRICREHGVTVLMVAHDVNPILRHLDTVVYLAHRRAAIGTPADVITSASLTDLFGTPIEVLRASDGRLVVVGGPDAPAVHSDRHTDTHPDQHSDLPADPPSDPAGGPGDRTGGAAS